MQEAQTVGIDLPLKALVWEHASGITWLSYNGRGVGQRHGLGHEADATASALAAALEAIAKTAAAPQ
jgi:uncharacterized protein (DUF302 family)